MKTGILTLAALLFAACATETPTGTIDTAPLAKSGKTKVAQGVTIEPIGDPIWKPVDFHFAAIEIGTPESGYAEFIPSLSAVLPEPDHTIVPALGIGPGAAHTGFATEIGEGLSALGIREAVQFPESDFSDGMGVTLLFMTVPDPGVIGSSPDFASGPVIPNSVFPIVVRGPALHNGVVFDPWLAYFDVPALTGAIDPRFTGLTGHSHFPMFAATNASFGPGGKLTGSYEYQFSMIDQTGNGWKIDAHFAIGH